MTPADELMALAGRWEAIYAEHGFDALSLAAQDLRALLDSDAFRAMARDAERLEFLESTGWPGQFQAVPFNEPAMRWFDCEKPGSDYSPTLRAAIDAAIDAAAGGAGE